MAGSITCTASTAISRQDTWGAAGGCADPHTPSRAKSIRPSETCAAGSRSDQVVVVVTGTPDAVSDRRASRPPSSGPCVPPSRKRRRPERVRAKNAASCWSSVTAGSTTRVRASTSSPSGVARTPNRPRSKSVPPSVRSIRFSCALSVGWDSPSAFAARVRLPASAISLITLR